jgi:steroid delta-isomerase
MNRDIELERLVRFYETIDVADLAAPLALIYAPDARFKDPFNDVRGLASIEKIFTHMFKQVERPRFVVTTRVIQKSNAFLTWDFLFNMKALGEGQQCIRGATHISFDMDGLVILHRDYWDAAEELYEKLPLVGRLMRCMKSRMAA